jgi:hypothetical protein
VGGKKIALHGSNLCKQQNFLKGLERLIGAY